jgi:hypothetical protein
MNVCYALRGVILVLLALTSISRADEPVKPSLNDIAVSAPAASTLSAPGVQVNATSQGGSASIKIGHDSPTLTEDNKFKFTNWSVTASAPTSKSSDLTQLATLDGLANAATISLDFFHFFSPLVVPNDTNRQKRKEICSSLEKAYQSMSPADRTKAQNKYKDAGDDPGQPPNGCCQDDPANPREYECNSGTFDAYDPTDQFRAERWKTGVRPGGFVYGGGAKLGYQQFTDYDPTTLAKATPNKTPWSANFYGAWNPLFDIQSFLIAKFEFQDGYKDATSKVLCPAPSGKALTCVSGPIGTPVHTESKVLSLEERRIFTWPFTMGISVVPQYDLQAKVFAVNLPIYFVPSAGSKGLSGGLQAGWRNDTHSFSFGVFAASAFSFFPAASK